MDSHTPPVRKLQFFTFNHAGFNGIFILMNLHSQSVVRLRLQATFHHDTLIQYPANARITRDVEVPFIL